MSVELDPVDAPALHPPTAQASKQRKCTDCCCLLIFFVCVSAMVVIQFAAAELGDPNKLTHGSDYTGAVCGLDTMVDKPYTHYPRLGKDLVTQRSLMLTSPWSIELYGLCVEKCPAQDEEVRDYPCDKRDPSCLWSYNPLVGWWSDESNTWHTAVSTSALMGRCMPVAITDADATEVCAYPDCHLVGKPCYKEAFPSENYWLPADATERGMCERLVKLSTARVSSSPESDIESEFIGAFFGGIAGTVEQLSMALLELGAIGIVFAMLVNFVLLRVLRTCMAVIFALTVALLLLLLAFANVFLFAKAGMLDVSGATSSAIDAITDLTHKLNMSRVSSAVDIATGDISDTLTSNAELFDAVADDKAKNFTTAAWLCLAATVAVLVVLAIVTPKLKNALAICAMATEPIAAMPGMLLLPVASVLLGSVVVVNFFATVVMFLTPDPQAMTDYLVYFTGNLTNAVLDAAGETVLDVAGGNADAQQLGTNLESINVQLQEEGIDPVALVYSLAGYEVFSCLWLLFLIEAVAYTTISGAVSYWYFTGSQKEDDLVDPADRTRFPILASLYRCLRFHLGSLAFGSFVLALFTILRAVLAYVDEKTRGLQETNFTFKLVIKCARCCLWVFDKVLKFLTKFAFVTIATDGTSFCRATAASFRLTTDHPIQMLANEAAMAVLSLLLVFVTPLVCAILAYNAVKQQWRSYLFTSFDAAGGWGQSLCEKYESNSIDACGYKSDFLTFVAPLALSDWEPTEKPDALKVAIATLILSFWVTRIFRDVYAASVDTIFVCCVKVEDQPVCKRYQKEDIHDTVMRGSTKNLLGAVRP